MDTAVKTSLWQQFGAAIDMLADAINACPAKLWQAEVFEDPEDKPEYTQFWYLATHTLVWLDLYLSGYSEGFTPPEPFKREELPKNPYTKKDLLAYLGQCRSKCQATIEGLTDEKAQQRCRFNWGEVSFFELQLYNMRHVMEHGAQLRLLLGQERVPVNDWVSRAEAIDG